VKCQVLKATIENKTTSVTTHFKKVTTGNNVFIVSVIVLSNCHIMQILHQMFNVSALLLDDGLKPATPLTKMVNGKWLPDFIERLKASAWHQLYLPLLPFTHARSESINADSLKLQLFTARKKERWPATADSLPQAVYLTTVKHTALVGIEPTTFRS